MSEDLTFVDSNILVYAYDVDSGPKHIRAKNAVAGLWRSQTGTVSIQVLQEFYVIVTRRLPKQLDARSAREVIATYQAWPVYSHNVSDVISASELEGNHAIGFWDALIVVAARQSGCTRLLSEHLEAGQWIAGLQVFNPLL